MRITPVQQFTFTALVRRVLSLGFAGLAAVVMVFAILFTVDGINVQNELQGEKLSTLALGANRFAARVVKPFLEFEQTDGITKVVHEVRESVGDCAYAAVVSDGKLVAAEPASLLLSPDMVPRLNGEMANEVRVNGLPVKPFAAPIESDSGKHYLLVGIDMTSHLARAAALRNRSIIIAVLCLGVATVVAYFVWRAMLKRAEVLDEQTGKDGEQRRSAAEQIRSSANDMLSVAKQTESNAANEASSVDETRRTMVSLLEAANEIAEAAQEVLRAAERSTEASGAIADRISTLNAQSLKIADISEAIQTIADKSDILALNASLEGAKAGEAGRGFVLVGAEMRRLAEMVMGAVRQIKQLTGEIRHVSEAAVLAAEEGRKLSAETTEVSRRITTITGQQRSGTLQVSQAMDEIQEFTQQALSGARQTRSTANNLAETAEQLTRLLGDEARERN